MQDPTTTTSYFTPSPAILISKEPVSGWAGEGGVATGNLEGKFTQRGDWIQPDTLFQPETNDGWMRPLTYCCALPRFRVNWEGWKDAAYSFRMKGLKTFYFFRK